MTEKIISLTNVIYQNLTAEEWEWVFATIYDIKNPTKKQALRRKQQAWSLRILQERENRPLSREALFMRPHETTDDPILLRIDEEVAINGILKRKNVPFRLRPILHPGETRMMPGTVRTRLLQVKRVKRSTDKK
jgi:hypothetical protein